MLIEQIESEDPQQKFSQTIYELLTTGELSKKLNSLFAETRGNFKLPIDLDLLRDKSIALYNECLAHPIEMTRAFEQIVQEVELERIAPEGDMRMEQTWRVSFEGNLGKHTVTPRGLKASLINALVKVQGIVISSSKVRHRLLKSSHYCEATKSFLTFNYSDGMALRQSVERGTDTRNQVPLYDNHENPIAMEYGLSEYRDVQILTIQEMPENIPTGLLSRSVEVVLQEDMVDTVKPGDRIQVIGVFRPEATAQTVTNSVFRNSIMATSVNILTAASEGQLSAQEIKEIKKVASRPDLYKLLVRSIAPAIAETNDIKEAVLLLLLGGTEKLLNNGIKLRGDINLLLVGDPSTGKSQMLRRVLNLANLSFSTTGRGSTGVGLTAAITIDKDTGEKQLEAGAMVLADRGVICVDEFDKMSIEDRVAMHEVMEQQTVTIAKAGIHVSLNARCSVVAAANPRYGEYNSDRSASVNISMPDSLLSRFDLVFIVQDKHDREIDRVISQRVTHNHRYQGANPTNNYFADASGVIEPAAAEDAAQGPLRVFEQFNPMLHENRNTDYLTQPFLKKYLNYAKRLEPKLSEATSQLISKKWTFLREFDQNSAQSSHSNRIINVTIRSLESLIRLSTAYAKARLAAEVTVEDVVRAFSIFNTAFYGSTENVSKSFWREVRLPNELKNDFPQLFTRGKPPVKTEVKVLVGPGEEAGRIKNEAVARARRERIRGKGAEGVKMEAEGLAERAAQFVVALINFGTRTKTLQQGIPKQAFWDYVREKLPNQQYPTLKIETLEEFDELVEYAVTIDKISVSEDRLFVV